MPTVSWLVDTSLMATDTYNRYQQVQFSSHHYTVICTPLFVSVFLTALEGCEVFLTSYKMFLFLSDVMLSAIRRTSSRVSSFQYICIAYHAWRHSHIYVLLRCSTEYDTSSFVLFRREGCENFNYVVFVFVFRLGLGCVRCLAKQSMGNVCGVWRGRR